MVNTTNPAVYKDDSSNIKQATLNHLNAYLIHMPPQSFMELRSFPDKGKGGKPGQLFIQTNTTEADLMQAVRWAIQQAQDGHGIFLGCNPRAIREGSKKSVKQMIACYVDLDLEKHGIRRDVALRRIEHAPIRPDLIVNSGRGLHLIHFFEPITDKNEWSALQRKFNEFYAMVGSDSSLVNDEARVLRLSPFPNQKEEQPRATGIISYTPQNNTFGDLKRAFNISEASMLRADEYKPLIMPEEIVEGGGAEYNGRNDLLFREACALRERGYMESEIFSTLLAVNELRCQPPLEDDEVERIAKSASRYEAGDTIQREAQAILPDGDLFTDWGVMSRMAYEKPEYLIYGLCRGDVGMVVAVTNHGKSTLLRNLSVSLACGEAFLSLVSASEPKRVMLLDYETAQARYVDDLKRMVCGRSERSKALIGDNLRSYVAKARGVPYLNLSDTEHFNRLAKEAKKFQPDVIVIDTLSAGYAVSNENDNSEITNKVMKPLTKLAVEANAVVLFSHHIGKAGSEEGSASNRSYRARGASAFEGMSTAAIQLDIKKSPEGERVLVLGFTKVKDEPKPDLVLKLNKETRCFEAQEGETAIENSDEKYHRMLATITKPMRAKEIEEIVHFLSDSTCKRYLKRALKEGRLEQPKQGLYQQTRIFPSTPHNRLSKGERLKGSASIK